MATRALGIVAAGAHGLVVPLAILDGFALHMGVVVLSARMIRPTWEFHTFLPA